MFFLARKFSLISTCPTFQAGPDSCPSPLSGLKSPERFLMHLVLYPHPTAFMMWGRHEHAIHLSGPQYLHLWATSSLLAPTVLGCLWSRTGLTFGKEAQKEAPPEKEEGVGGGGLQRGKVLGRTAWEVWVV